MLSHYLFTLYRSVRRQWLYAALSPAYLIGASLLTVSVAVVTIAGQAYGVARADPGKALRYE